MTGESSVEEIGEAGFFVLNGIFYSPFQNDFGSGSGYHDFRLKTSRIASAPLPIGDRERENPSPKCQNVRL